MRSWLARRRRWIVRAPRDLLVVIAVAATWGGWLAHTLGRDWERARFDRIKTKLEAQCVRPPSGRTFSDI